LIVARKKRGVYADSAAGGATLEDKVADFSYESDALAQLIVDAWTSTPIRNNLTTGTMANRSGAAKTALSDRGIYLEQPIVITEQEYENGFSLADASLPNGVVFVLPNLARAPTTSSKPLLETAKLLMAITPNGI
jgi:hypothetical protein